MKKGHKIIIAVITILIVTVILILCFGIKWLFSEQYNEYGVSHFLVIKVDKTKPKEYIGELDNHKIYVEHLDLNETNFRNIKAENVSIKYAIDNNLVSIDEWRKNAFRIINYDDLEIIGFENYEIACTKEDCIIRPLSKY